MSPYDTMHGPPDATLSSDIWLYWNFRLKLPGSLQEKMDAWMTRGYISRYEFGVFLPPSWIAVLLGQNLHPGGYDRRADEFPDKLI